MIKDITCFIASLAGGGAEHQMIELVRLLSDKGYKVNLVTFIDEKDHYNVDGRVRRIRLAQGKSNFRKIVAILKYFVFINNATTICFSQRSSVFVLAALLFRPHIKVLSSDRNCILTNTDIYEKILMHGLWKRANYIVPNSISQKTNILSKKPSWGRKVRPILNYTNLKRFQFSQIPIGNTIEIGIFARFNYQKNWKLFSEMLSLLKSKTSIKFHIDWYGNQYYKDKDWNPDYLEFKDTIEKKNLTDIIELHSAVNDVECYIPKYEAICLPSLFEGFSNSVAEAICCGRPMLVSDVSDNSLMVKDGENGYLFDPQNVNAMCDAFLSFFSLSYEEKVNMGMKSRKIAEELFDENVFINSYINLIEN